MKNRWLVLCLLLTAPACDEIDGPDDDDGDERIVGSGNVVTETREVAGFSAVSVSGVARIRIEQTGQESLTITAEDNILPVLISEVTGGELTLGQPENVNLITHAEILYELTVKKLSSLQISGVMNATALGLDTDALDIVIDGVNTLSASGRADVQSLRVSGVTTYYASGLASREVVVRGSGVVTMTLNVRERLDVRACGAGTIDYEGDPEKVLDPAGCRGIALRRL